ncbi:MAG: MCE family protein [Planctomycetota bacterium]|nr:MAG: MCE family protein [Planctomycetota bacterium]
MRMEAKIGLLFFASLILLVWFAIFVTGLNAGSRTYEVRFDRVMGLRNGDAVLYNGVRVGTVTDITPVRNGEGGSEVAVFFDIERRMREAVVIGDDLSISVQQGLLGGGSLSISSSGSGSEIEPGLMSQVRGREPVDLNTAMAQVVDLIAENRQDIRSTMQELPRAVGSFGDMSEEIQATVAENREVLTQALENMRDMMGGVREVVAENREDLRTSITRLADLLENLQGMVQENRPNLRAAIEHLPTLTEEFAGVGQELRAMITHNRERIDTIIAGFANFAPRLDRIGADVERVTSYVASGQGSLGRAIFDDELHETAVDALDSVGRRADEVSDFTKTFATMRLYGGIEGGYGTRSETGRGTAYLRLEPRNWKYYELGVSFRHNPYLIAEDDEDPFFDERTEIDPHLAVGFRFLPSDAMERHRLDVAGGLFDGQVGLRAGFALHDRVDAWIIARLADDERLPNREPRESGNLQGRAWLSVQLLRGVYVEAGADSLYHKPGPYAGMRFEILDRDLANLFAVSSGM